MENRGDSRNLSFFVADQKPQTEWPEYQDKKSRETWMAEVAIILTFIGPELLSKILKIL